MNFILFNGPPGAGKDTAGMFAQWHIWSRYSKGGPPVVWERFSSPSKMAFAAMTHATLDGWFNVDGYEKHKDENIPWLKASYRQFQIDFSEKFMKPMYGREIFGKLLLVRCWEHIKRQKELHKSDKEPIFVVADCGFQVEMDVLSTHNVLLITIERSGKTFEGDSREWVEAAEHHQEYRIMNNAGKRDMRDQVEFVVDRWLEKINETAVPIGRSPRAE